VGRRLWRRRKRRSTDGTPTTDAAGNLTPDTTRALPQRRDQASKPEDTPGSPSAPPRGLWARLFGRSPAETPPPSSAPASSSSSSSNANGASIEVILAIPRGVTRWDAFEQRLSQLVPGTAEHRVVALAYHRELVALVAESQVDLALFEARVQACAHSLVAAGEEEKAGSLLARIGRRHQAAELFAKAGAIDALEEAHAELAFAEGGPRLDARLAFERFEALFLVGRRTEALAALERAVALWENPVYVEVKEGFLGRLPSPRQTTWRAGADVVHLTRQLPLVLGRSADSVVRIDSPLVSRAHVEIRRHAGELVLRDLVSSAGTRLDGQPLTGSQPLSSHGTIDLAGVVIDYDLTASRLLMRPRLRPQEHTLVMRGAQIDEPLLGCAVSVIDGRLHVCENDAVWLNDEVVRHDMLVLIGDRLRVGTRTWLVTA
jgi:tetratricopeptide (TPR) repeat protein